MFTKSFDRNSQPNTTPTHGHQAVFAKGFLLALFLLLVSSAATSAATYVTNTAELIAAIVKANVPGPINSIYMKPGTYLIPTAFPGTPDNAFPVITGRISIVGLVDGAVIVRSGTALFRFFEVAPTGQLWIDRLTFRLGQGNIFGGAILNHGSLTVSSSYFIGNAAVNLSGESVGGAIYNGGGKLVVRNSSIWNNRAAMGGGIGSDGSLPPAPYQVAQVTVETSAFIENQAMNNGWGAMGGGMFIRGAHAAELHDNTFSYNFAQMYGGGIAVQTLPIVSQVVLRNLTILVNNAAVEGGGIYYNRTGIHEAADIKIHNSIVTQNGSPSSFRDFGGNGVYTSLGHNIYGLYSSYMAYTGDIYAPALPLASLTYHYDNKPGVQFSKVGQAASKICRDRACQTPLNKSARKRAIWAAPVSDQRMPCNFNRAPVT